ncbi:MAG: HAD family hydrolase, partial [Candidatus Nanoarchaeia archaeon]
CKLHDGMKKAIKDIWYLGRFSKDPSRNQSMKFAINTTNSWKSIYPELVENNILQYFDSFCTAETLKNYDGSGNHSAMNKPSKVSVALMLYVLGTDGGATIHIGDTLSDLKASIDVRRFGGLKSENLITVGCAWGFDGKDTLKEGVKTNGGTVYFQHIADKPSDLPEIIRMYM